MREKKLYICDICGTQYGLKDAALCCEKNHKNPVKIINSRYLSKAKNEKGLPETIAVEFDDGSVVTYKH